MILGKFYNYKVTIKQTTTTTTTIIIILAITVTKIIVIWMRSKINRINEKERGKQKIKLLLVFETTSIQNTIANCKLQSFFDRR